MKNLLYVIPFMIFIATVGGYLLNLGFEIRQVHQDVQLWPSARAKVISTGLHTWEGRKNSPASYAAIWNYQFAVDQKIYQSSSDSVLFGNKTVVRHEQGDAIKDQSLHPIGSELTIFYNPIKPTETVVEKREDRSAYQLPIVVGIIVIMISLFGSYYLFKVTKLRKRTPIDTEGN